MIQDGHHAAYPQNLSSGLLSTSLFPGFPAFAASPLTLSIGSVPAPSTINRIVSAGGPADLLLLAAAPEKLAGFSSFDFSHAPIQVLPEAIRRLPKPGRLAGRATTLSMEQLMALKPDVIVDCGNADETWTSQARRVSELTHIPWVLISGELASSPAQLQAIGALAGTETRTARQAELAKHFIDDAQA